MNTREGQDGNVKALQNAPTATEQTQWKTINKKILRNRSNYWDFHVSFSCPATSI